MRRAGRFEKGVKLPLDFTHRIRYNKSRSKNDAPVCRNGRRGGLKIPCANNTCGFDPHHRHKKEAPSACLGELLFYLRRVSGSNSTALLCRASDQPCGLSLSARETPTTGIKKRTSPACLGEFSFLSAACERVEQHGPALQGERSALRAVAQCAGDPHHRHKKENFPSLSGGVFFFICGV